MFNLRTVLLTLIASLLYGYLELQFESGVVVSALVTLYLFYQRFYLVPFLLLIANIAGIIYPHSSTSYGSAVLLLLHVLFSAPKAKILQMKVTETKEKVIVVEKSSANRGIKPPSDVVADTYVESVSTVSNYVDEDEELKKSHSNNANLVKRKSASDRSMIEAARLEARKAEEERMTKIIQDRILSPGVKEKSK